MLTLTLTGPLALEFKRGERDLSKWWQIIAGTR